MPQLARSRDPRGWKEADRPILSGPEFTGQDGRPNLVGVLPRSGPGRPSKELAGGQCAELVSLQILAMNVPSASDENAISKSLFRSSVSSAAFAFCEARSRV